MSHYMLDIHSASAASDGHVETQAATVASSDSAAPVELSADKMLRDNLMLLGVLFFIFYFILIRPQQKRVRLHQEMMKSLKKGDKVVTNGGLIGTIVKFDGDDIVLLEVAQSVRVQIAKSSISEVTGGKSGESANDN